MCKKEQNTVLVVSRQVFYKLASYVFEGEMYRQGFIKFLL